MVLFVQPSLSSALGFAGSEEPSENIYKGIKAGQRQGKGAQDSEGLEPSLSTTSRVLLESCFGPRGSGERVPFLGAQCGS